MANPQTKQPFLNLVYISMKYHVEFSAPNDILINWSLIEYPFDAKISLMLLPEPIQVGEMNNKNTRLDFGKLETL